MTYLTDKLVRKATLKTAVTPPVIHFKLRGKKKGAEGSFIP